jgi:hypothetical protein
MRKALPRLLAVVAALCVAAIVLDAPSQRSRALASQLRDAAATLKPCCPPPHTWPGFELWRNHAWLSPLLRTEARPASRTRQPLLHVSAQQAAEAYEAPGPQQGAEELEALRAGAAANLTQLVRLWFHHNATLPSQWPEQRKECAPGCTRLGNCNAQTGECECPYGRAGPACETLLLPACR